MMRRLLSLPAPRVTLLTLVLVLPLLAGAPARAQDRQAGAAAPQGAAASASAAAPASAAASAPAPASAAAPAPAAPAAPDVAAPNPAASGAPAATRPLPASGPAAVPGDTLHTAPVAMPAASATGSLLQTLFALIVVLGVLAALAWALKRYGPRAGLGNANIKVVGSLNLGGRERLLVVEIGNQWIVVGASPGRVNGLATMPKQEGLDAGATLTTPGPSANSFADWLRQTIDKRK